MVNFLNMSAEKYLPVFILKWNKSTFDKYCPVIEGKQTVTRKEITYGEVLTGIFLCLLLLLVMAFPGFIIYAMFVVCLWILDLYEHEPSNQKRHDDILKLLNDSCSDKNMGPRMNALLWTCDYMYVLDLLFCVYLVLNIKMLKKANRAVIRIHQAAYLLILAVTLCCIAFEISLLHMLPHGHDQKFFFLDMMPFYQYLCVVFPAIYFEWLGRSQKKMLVVNV